MRKDRHEPTGRAPLELKLRTYQKLRSFRKQERPGRDPFAPSEGSWSHQHLDLGLLSSRTQQGDNKFLLLKSLSLRYPVIAALAGKTNLDSVWCLGISVFETGQHTEKPRTTTQGTQSERGEGAGTRSAVI